MGYCKGIYAGCSILANATCRPCERIARGRSTVEKEIARKDRTEVPRPYRKPDKRKLKAPADPPTMPDEVYQFKLAGVAAPYGCEARFNSEADRDAFMEWVEALKARVK
jgi:hypothetical protein